MSEKSSPHVLIVGAGLGGLTLAQTLRKQEISFEIFERDRDEHSRSQGWAIGLHTMLDDLHASLPDDMPPIGGTNHLLPLTLPAQITFYNSNDPSYRTGVQDDGSGRLIRANRARLRSWLATKIPIQFGKTATRIEETDRSVTVHFEDGTSATGDVLIGADGSHSIARRHLLGQKDLLSTVPAGVVVGELTLSGRAMSQQLELGHSCYVRLTPMGKGHEDDGLSLFVGLSEVQPDAKTGQFYWLLGWPDPAAADEPYWTASASGEKLRELAMRKIRNLAPEFRAIVEQTTVEGIRTPPIVFRDIELTKEKLKPALRTTILGDAAHCMTPFRGEGGVHAMTDALALGRAIGSARDDGSKIPQMIDEYLDEMLPRGLNAVKLSRGVYMDADAGSANRRRFTWGLPAEELPPERISL